MQAAVEAIASPEPANASLPLVPANATTLSPGGSGFSILLPTLSAVLGLLDPKILLRAVLRVLVSIAIHPTMVTEPTSWSGGTLTITQISRPRPPSLLSEVHSIASATRFSILNNTFLDVLEGQLICLAIITAFILVFLIREWVINQQPLLNQPDPDPAENAAPPQRPDEPRRAARRRRQNQPRIPGADVERNIAPNMHAHPRIRRVATENNILVQNQDMVPNRPLAPQRAASLVPALQEFEDTARLLGDYPSIALPPSSDQAVPLESPPLHRGMFDEVGYIRRTIEEREDSSVGNPRETNEDGRLATFSEPTAARSLIQSNANDVSLGRGDMSEDTTQSPADMRERQGRIFQQIESEDEAWISDSGTDILPTPQSSSGMSQEIDALGGPTTHSRRASGDSREHLPEVPSESSETLVENETPQDRGEPETLWTKVSKWLWHTDDYVEGEAGLQESGDSENIVNVNAQDLFAPAPGEHGELPGVGAVVPGPPHNPPPNIQNGVNLNNPDAVDDAEDLEGIMELLGMEGPLAGMIQNIIFSIFLITLTLSGSIWCPYIWGKITLLFVAHPFSVFVKAPLEVLSRTADFIIDIVLLVVGILGVLLNQFTKLAKLAVFLVSPSWSRYINPDLLDKMSISLSHRSGARLEKSFMRAVVGFRPDLPTFSVQAHHVLRVFTKTGADIGSALASDLTSSLTDAGSSMTWQKVFTAPVKIGALAKGLPDTSLVRLQQLKVWHEKFQKDLRPLSFTNPSEIDLTLVQWSSKEKIACIALGYALFAIVGYMYLKVAPYMYGLKKGEKVPGFLADTLRQAGGVMKVIIIIGIEMIAFPLYCGTMLDFALLPIFEGATLQTRLQFFATSPLTALFVHWFIGTCYMFHFALFVSMCRKIMRKGVLYFIRDPDDPTFHPVRDVLERPVATQLGKIAFSAFVYGSMLVICLGGVIASLDRFGGILPLRWNVADPLAIVPGDIIFFNFVLPFVLRKVDLSEKLSAVFEWWFRACAAGLRLSDFMFGIDDEKEKEPGSFLWRRFLNGLFFEEEANPLKDLKEVAKSPERLLWFEADEAGSIEQDVREVVGPDVRFRNIHQFELGNKAQALLEFEDASVIQKIKQEINVKPQEASAWRLRAKSISEIQVDVRSLRETRVDVSAGMYVRAPAKDSVRIPKGTKVFVQVNEKNERLDGVEDKDDGLHGKKNEKFSRIYVPNHFKARVLTFVALVWAFAAMAGLALSVGPLLLGRLLIAYFTNVQKPVNDLYAITVGLHAFCIAGYAAYNVFSRWRSTTSKVGYILSNIRQTLPWAVTIAKRVAGLLYLTVVLGMVLPIALSFVAELYINIPLLTYLLASEESPSNTDSKQSKPPAASVLSVPTINLIQSWALGLLYLRLVIRLMKTTPNSRAAAAIRNITRHGLLRLDVRLATRAVILPVAVGCMILLGLPPLAAHVVLKVYPHDLDEGRRVNFYRYSYPAIMSTAVGIYMIMRLRKKVEAWRVKIKDEVYLIGERLHNFPVQEDHDKKRSKGGALKPREKKGKGKGKEREISANIQSSSNGMFSRRHDIRHATLDASIQPIERDEPGMYGDFAAVAMRRASRRGSTGGSSQDAVYGGSSSASDRSSTRSPFANPDHVRAHDTFHEPGSTVRTASDKGRFISNIEEHETGRSLKSTSLDDDIGDLGRHVFDIDEYTKLYD